MQNHEEVCMFTFTNRARPVNPRPQPFPRPEPPRPAARSPFRSTGHLAACDPDAYAQLQEEWDDLPAASPLTEADLDDMAHHYGQQ
jgi:hypothetical protein